MPRNQLLSRFPSAVLKRLERHLSPLDMPAGREIHRAGSEVEAVCFPLDSIISVVLPTQAGGRMQVGIVGNREMVGLNALMGARELTDTAYVVQVPGTAVCVPADLILREFSANYTLRSLLLKYAQSYIAQLSQNVVCAGTHTVRQRIARTLLETYSRSGQTELALTHETLSLMVGVRRAGITKELASLARSGVIESRRRHTVIRDEAQLAEVSCECFATLRKEYRRLLN